MLQDPARRNTKGRGSSKKKNGGRETDVKPETMGERLKEHPNETMRVAGSRHASVHGHWVMHADADTGHRTWAHGSHGTRADGPHGGLSNSSLGRAMGRVHVMRRVHSHWVMHADGQTRTSDTRYATRPGAGAGPSGLVNVAQHVASPPLQMLQHIGD